MENNQASEGSETTSADVLPIHTKHEIAQAINKFLHQIRDIEFCARNFIPAAAKIHKEQATKISQEIKDGRSILDEKDEKNYGIGANKILEAIRRAERLSSSRIPLVLESSLFLGMFSAFDTFTGDLLTAIYNKNPKLYLDLNRSVPVSEILKYESFEELKAITLQDEIETFRRQSYVEQFDDLEKRFGFKTLKAFEKWPDFVECGQRRNLMTHCDGTISEQYIKICKEQGYKFPKPVKIGDKLSLGAKYVLPSCELMMEVGLKLGQTIWRKCFPSKDEIKIADIHLKDVIYEFLQLERWKFAQVVGEFATTQQKYSDEAEHKIAIINYCIALKFDEKKDLLNKQLSIDWSDSVLDLRLAETVLRDNFKLATEFMKKIGEKGEYIEETAYYRWPLFKEFRNSPEFKETYEIIYHHPFIDELQKVADKAQESVSEQISGDSNGGERLLPESNSHNLVQ
jgi:hypothetical protein